VKKIAVTGASGHIGANLVRELIARGYQVVALVRQTSLALEGLEVERVHADLEDIESLCRAFRGVAQVFHLAAYISIQAGEGKKLESVNVEGTRNVLKACESEGVESLVYFSSIHALDLTPLDQEVTEANPLLNEGHTHGGDYDHSKARAEQLVRQNTNEFLNTRIIYPTAVFGPNDFNRSLFGQVIRKLVQGRLPALVSGGFNWVDARDVAWGAVEIAEKAANNGRYILSGHYLSMTEVAAVIEELSGTAAPRFICPVWLARLFAPLMGLWARVQDETPVYTRDSLAAVSSNKRISHSLATEHFAYQPRSFRHTMQDVLHFYAEQDESQISRTGD
jgi:dihydroflavonol-4-reductase